MNSGFLYGMSAALIGIHYLYTIYCHVVFKLSFFYCNVYWQVPYGDVLKLSPNFFVNNLLEMVSLMNEIENNSENIPHCLSHEGRECELYCRDCSKLICFQCIVKWGACHDHLYCDVTEIANASRATILDYSEERKQLLPKVEQHVDLLQDMKARQVGNIADVCDAMEESFQKHVTNLNNRKRELVQSIYLAQGQGEDSLNNELDRMQVEKAKVVNTLEFCEKIIRIENPGIFVQKYLEVKERVFEINLPELCSQVEVQDIRFEENDALLRDVVLNYGRIVNRGKFPEERPPVPGLNDECKEEGIAENPGPLVQGESRPVFRHQNNVMHRMNQVVEDPGPVMEAERVVPNIQRNPANERSDVASGEGGKALSPAVNEPKGDNNNHGRVCWKLYPKNFSTHVSLENRGLSVESRSTKCCSVIGMPGFMNGKHSWKVRVENHGTGVGIGVCLGRNVPGLCVMLDSALTMLAPSIVVAVELDCEAKCVKVKPEGHPSNCIVFENQISSVHPYFMLFPGKITIVEMDGKSVDEDSFCSIL